MALNLDQESNTLASPLERAPGTARRRRWARPVLALYWIALAVATHWPHLKLPLPGEQSVIQPDKIVHSLVFAGLMALLLHAWPRGKSSRLKRATLACGVALGYAALDEWTQQWFGRGVSLSDWLAGTIGILSIYLATLATGRYRQTSTLTIYSARLTWLILAGGFAALAILPRRNGLVRWYASLEPHWRDFDNVIHFTVVMALTWLLAIAAGAGRRRPRASALLTVLVMAAAGPVIEILQSYTGRDYSVADVWADSLGLAAALAVWAIVLAGRTWAEHIRARQAAGDDASGAGASGASGASGGFVGDAIVVSGLTLLSRITGLVRDATLAAVLGLTSVSDAFFIGFLIPNLFRRLFGEGALTAAFIPHYAELVKEDPAVARRFVSLCLGLLTLALSLLTLLGEGGLWLVVHYGGAAMSAKTLLAVHLAMLMLPYMPLICLVALMGGALQVHGKFAAPAAAPVLLNLAMIAFAAWAALTSGLHGEPALRFVAKATAVGVLTAGMVQVAWQLIALQKVTRLSIHLAGTAKAFASMLRMFVPMIFGLAVFQINAFMDSVIAFFLSAHQGAGSFHLFGHAIAYPMQSGSVAALAWAQRLYQFPLGVFGIAIATAIYPALARAASNGPGREDESFRTILQHGLRLTVFIGLPASVGLVLLREPLTRLIYEHGTFTGADATRVAAILLGYATSIWAYSMMQVLTRAFYARKDATTPLRISTVMVGFNLALNLTLIWPLGAAGLAWSTAISAMLQVVWLLVAIRKHVDRPLDGRVLRGWRRSAILSAAMAIVLIPLLLMVDVHTLSQLATAGLLAVLVALGVLVVLGGAYLSGAEELRWLRRG